MQTMSRKKPTPKADPPAGEEPPKKRYPSRDAVQYVGIPNRMYRGLKKYAEQHSTEYDRKSITWAARVLFGPFLESLGLIDDEPEDSEEADS